MAPLNSQPRRLAWLISTTLFFSLSGCGLTAEPEADSDEFRSIEQLALGDDCDSTNQCKIKYGQQASDCKNSAADNSVCLCGGSTPCDSAPEPAPPQTGGADRTVHLTNKGQNAYLFSESRADGNRDDTCGGADATNVKASPTFATGAAAQFSLIPVEGDWFRVVSSDGKFLQCTNQADGDGLVVRLASSSCTGTWTQWRKVGAGNGTFRLENRAHGGWLQASGQTDVDSGSGNHLRAVATSFTGDLTRWEEEAVGGGGTTTPPDPGPSDPGNPAQYSGNTHWDSASGTLTYKSNGTLPNTHHGWNVPSQVKKIVIGAGVRVNGRFDITHTMEVQGENRNSSVLFGTPLQGYNKNNDGCGECKSAVRGEGNIVVTVKNLTSLNPYGFHFTGKKGAKFVLDSVNAIDDRDGHGNNSDGISAAGGSVVRNCYFESGDDIIKVYADIEVIDTHIKMVTNTVPIQFGWGSYGSGARGVFRNLKVSGNSGRGAADNALISGRSGTYNKEILIDGLDYQNSNGSVIVFREARGNADIEIKNAKIDVAKFRGRSWTMNSNPKVCGTVYSNGQGAPNSFDCR